jgi:hypothetical protein
MKHPLRYVLIVIAVLIASLVIYNSQTLNNNAGAPKALNGGQLTLHTSEFPKSFNAFVNNSADASQVFELVYTTLLDLDDNTLEYHPLIAKSWTISQDKKEFTFKLNPDAKWADGQPITASFAQRSVPGNDPMRRRMSASSSSRLCSSIDTGGFTVNSGVTLCGNGTATPNAITIAPRSRASPAATCSAPSESASAAVATRTRRVDVLSTSAVRLGIVEVSRAVIGDSRVDGRFD